MVAKLKHFFSIYKIDILVTSLLIILGITFPLLWLDNGKVVLGHDAGMPIDPADHLWDRLYTWSERIGMGTDNSQNVGALGIHALEALIYVLVKDLHLQQVMLFVIWIILPGLAMYTCVRSLFGRDRWFLNVFATLFYSYNHLLLQALWIFERTKFSLYTALPLAAAVLINFYRRRLGPLQAALYLSLILFVFNGGGFLPLFGAVLLLAGFTIVYYNCLYRAKQTLTNTLQFLGVFFVLSFFLQSYWILGYFVLIQGALNEQLASFGGIESIISWAEYISGESSLFNLLRLQGIIDWYGNEGHPYAYVFLTNPLLKLISYILAPLAFLSVIFVRDKKDKSIILLLALLALFSMIFIGGTHDPFGFLFMLFMQYIPGFAVFRTPYYKFAPALWFCYSILIGYALWYLVERFGGIKTYGKYVKSTLIACVVLIFALYNYPYFSGVFFEYMKGKRTTAITLPSYVTEFAQSVKEENPHARLLLLPPPSNTSSADTFIWKYWSLAPVTSLLLNTTSITSRADNTQTENDLVTHVHKAINENNPVWEKLQFLLGIDKVVLRHDFAVEEDSTVAPDLKEFKQILGSQKVFKDNQRFGAWEVFSVRDEASRPLIAALPKTIAIDANLRSAPMVLNKDFLTLLKLPYIDTYTNLLLTSIEPRSSIPINFTEQYWVPQCTFCMLQEEFPSLDRTEKILPFSIFFPLVERGEKQSIAKEKDWLKREALYFEILSKRAFGLREAMKARKKEPKMFLKTENELLNAMKTLKESTDRPSNSIDEDHRRMLKAIDYFYIAKTQIIQRMRENPFAAEKPILGALFDLADATLEEYITKVWKSENEFDKKYTLQVASTSSYEVLLHTQSLSSYDLANGRGQIALTIDDAITPTTWQQLGDNWIKLATLNLGQGGHKILLMDNTVRNVFSITPEMKNTYQDVQFSENAATMNASILRERCVALPVTNLSIGDYYKITFTYNIPDQYRTMLFKWDKDRLPKSDMSMLANQLLPTTQPQHYERIDLVQSTTMQLNFCSDFGVPRNIKKDAQFQISNIRIIKLAKPLLVFRKVIEAPHSDTQVLFEKINPTLYHIRVENAGSKQFILSFVQRFNRYWKLYPIENYTFTASLKRVNPSVNSFEAKTKEQILHKLLFESFLRKPIPEQQHVLVSGYANGWVLEQTGAQDYILIYEKQKWYVLGLFITSITVMSIMLLLVAVQRRRRGKA